MNLRILVETMRTPDGVVGTIRSSRSRKKLYGFMRLYRSAAVVQAQEAPGSQDTQDHILRSLREIRWGLKDPESGEQAQTRGRAARDRGLPLPKTCEDRVVA